MRPVLGGQIHYLWHLGGPPYFVPLDCIWHSNQPKGYVIYIHCHLSLSRITIPDMAKVTLHPNPTDSLSSLSYEALAVNMKGSSVLPFVPKEEKRLHIIFVHDVHNRYMSYQAAQSAYKTSYLSTVQSLCKMDPLEAILTSL